MPRCPRHFHILFALKADQRSLLVYRAPHDSAAARDEHGGNDGYLPLRRVATGERSALTDVSKQRARSLRAPHLTRGRCQSPDPLRTLRRPPAAAHPVVQAPWPACLHLVARAELSTLTVCAVQARASPSVRPRGRLEFSPEHAQLIFQYRYRYQVRVRYLSIVPVVEL